MSTMLARQTANRLPQSAWGFLGRKLGRKIAGWPVLWVGAARAALGGSLERSRQRNALARLDDRALRDLGLARERVETEVGKWFWQY